MKQGWEVKKLGDVCEYQKYSNKKTDLPYVGLEDIESHTGKFIGNLEPKSVKSLTFGFTAEHVLYGRLRPYLNKVLLPDFEGHCSTEIFPIKPKSILNRNYLFHWLIFSETMHRINATWTGATLPRANMNTVLEFDFNLPTLPEQQRIVGILDEVFDGIAKAKANAEQNLKNAQELFESYLQSVFENKGKGWEEKTIEDVCDEIFAGGDAPKDNFSLELNDKHQIPIYANAVKNSGLYGYTDFSRVSKPSITIAARGSGTGHTEIRFEQYLPIVRLIVLIPNLFLIDLKFLKHSIDNLEILRSGSAIPQLTIPMIKAYRLPLPPLCKQQTIVQKLDALSLETKKLETIYRTKIADLEELKKSILHKAFNGELR